MSRLWPPIIGFCAVLLVMDVIAAQLTDVMLDRLLFDENERKYRTPSPFYHHDLEPNVEAIAHWGPSPYLVRTNALGFKSNAVGEVELASSQPRLLFIGDSFTEGIGIPYEQTFAGHVASVYRKRGVEVLNAGVATYAPTIYYRKIRHLIETVGLQFDALAVFIDLSDIFDEENTYRVNDKGNVTAIAHALEYGQRLKNARDWLVRNSLIFRFGRSLKKEFQARIRKARVEPRDISCYLSGRRWDTEDQPYQTFGKAGLRRAAEAMDRLYRFTRERGIGLVIVIYPWPYNIADKHIHSRQVTFWRAWAEGREVSFLNLFPAFVTDETPENVIRRNFIECDVHWNAAGHKLVADSFLRQFPDAASLQYGP